jgi:hypothetical protein
MNRYTWVAHEKAVETLVNLPEEERYQILAKLEEVSAGFHRDFQILADIPGELTLFAVGVGLRLLVFQIDHASTQVRLLSIESTN